MAQCKMLGLEKDLMVFSFDLDPISFAFGLNLDLVSTPLRFGLTLS